MSRDRLALLAELGVDPTSSPVKTIAPAAKAVSEGLSGASATSIPPLDQLSPVFGALDLEGTAPLRVGRHQVVPEIYCVEDAHQALAGDARIVDDVVRLDARAGRRSGATFETAAGRFAVEVGPEGLVVHALANDVVGDIQTVSLELELPPVPDLSFLAEPAVSVFIATLAGSPSIVDRAAAVGMATRLHVPAHHTQKAVLDGRIVSPTKAAEDWAKRLSPTTRDGLERLALERAVELRESLAQVDDDLTGEALVSLLHERETLACVQELLWLARGGDRLSAELRGADAIASTKASYFVPDEPLADDALLEAVAGADPAAWWATLCVGD